MKNLTVILMSLMLSLNATATSGTAASASEIIRTEYLIRRPGTGIHKMIMMSNEDVLGAIRRQYTNQGQVIISVCAVVRSKVWFETSTVLPNPVVEVINCEVVGRKEGYPLERIKYAQEDLMRHARSAFDVTGRLVLGWAGGLAVGYLAGKALNMNAWAFANLTQVVGIGLVVAVTNEKDIPLAQAIGVSDDVHPQKDGSVLFIVQRLPNRVELYKGLQYFEVNYMQ